MYFSKRATLDFSNFSELYLKRKTSSANEELEFDELLFLRGALLVGESCIGVGTENRKNIW